MDKIPVGILGATGIVGQHYLHLLQTHPWFEVSFLAASEKSAGKTYKEAIESKWHMKSALSSHLGSMQVESIDSLESATKQCQFVFSALSTEIAKEYEPRYAAAGLPVISNAAAYRESPDVPLLIPEVNADHLKILPIQQKNRGWTKGFIVVKPNCSLQAYLTPVYALHRNYPIQRLFVTTMQSLSGAGHPGVASIDIVDNVIPYIHGEEEKSERETVKILGSIHHDRIKPDSTITVSAHCNRVPVLEGHMACVSIEFKDSPPSQEEILHALREFRALPQQLNLPSAPKHPILYREERDRPQPRLDKDCEQGMPITVGRLRPCPLFHYRFVGLSHNTMRGAAGGGILNAELLVAQNYL